MKYEWIQAMWNPYLPSEIAIVSLSLRISLESYSGKSNDFVQVWATGSLSLFSTLAISNERFLNPP